MIPLITDTPNSVLPASRWLPFALTKKVWVICGIVFSPKKVTRNERFPYCKKRIVFQPSFFSGELLNFEACITLALFTPKVRIRRFFPVLFPSVGASKFFKQKYVWWVRKVPYMSGLARKKFCRSACFLSISPIFCGQKANKTTSTYIMSDINLVVDYSGVFQCSGYHQNIAMVPNSDTNSDMVPKTLWHDVSRRIVQFWFFVAPKIGSAFFAEKKHEKWTSNIGRIEISQYPIPSPTLFTLPLVTNKKMPGHFPAWFCEGSMMFIRTP